MFCFFKGAGLAGLAGAVLANRAEWSYSMDLGALSCKYLPRIYPKSTRRPHKIGVGWLGRSGLGWAGLAGLAGLAGARLANRAKRSLSTALGALRCKYLPGIYLESTRRPQEIWVFNGFFISRPMDLHEVCDYLHVYTHTRIIDRSTNKQ